MRRIAELVGPRGQNLTLLGGILGLAADENVARDAFQAAKPDEVLLGVPFEDLDAIRATQGKETTSEFESADLDDDYVRRLKKYGETKTPPPDLYALHALAEEKKIPIRAIDLADEAYTEAYTKNIGIFEVLKSNRNQRKLPSIAIDAPSAEEFAIRWDYAVFPTKGLRKLQELREVEMVACIQKTIPHRVLALIPLARLDGVVKKLKDAGWKPSSSTAYRD